MNTADTRDAEANNPTNGDPHPRRQRSSIPTFIFISLVLYVLTDRGTEDSVLRNQYQEALESLNHQLGNYSAWLNGTESNFTLPTADTNLTPLVESFMTFGPELVPETSSYYSNLTGFWRGDIRFYNLTDLPVPSDGEVVPEWYHLAKDFVAGANMTNMTEVAERIGPWNWTASNKLAISVGDKLVYPEKATGYANVSQEIAMIHGKIDFSDPDSSDEFRLDFDGVHFVKNGSIYAFAESNSRPSDIRVLPSLIPEQRINETAHVIAAEMTSRIAKLKEKISSGKIDTDSDDDDSPKSGCSFLFFGQVDPTDVPQDLMKELEDEIDEPTGITTVPRPPMKMNGVVVSKNCGMLYVLKDINGLKSERLYRKITSYAGFSTIVNFILLVLFTRQTSRSGSATGLARVSRYPFLAQSLIDAVAFVGHITLGILAEGRPAISVLAPAGLSCILFVQEAQFAVLIGQIQAPEDVETAIRPTPPPAPTTPATTTEPSASNGNDNDDSDETTPLNRPNEPAPPAAVPPTTPPTIPPHQQSFFRFLIHHIRTDPTARLWTIISFFLIVVFRIVVMLSLPLLFIGSLYAFLWIVQIYRAVRRGRTSGLSAEYLIGTTLGRLYFLLYFLACPKNVLDIEPRPWVYLIALIMIIQVIVLLLQDIFGPSFFLPGRVGTIDSYDYHPPMPLPDPESPEQSLGDCAICMDAILVDPSLRDDKKSEGGGILGKHRLWGQGARKTYSLAPCHHLFHTACLERWLAIKNICPQCRRPLPPL
ncbi:hypothetical protein ABKN59_006994 [Abortiporus biennis]